MSTERKSDFNSLQQWWDVGKCQVTVYSQYQQGQSQVNQRTRCSEVMYMQSLAEPTGDQRHIEAHTDLSSLLGVKAQGMLVRSRFMNAMHMDATSHYFCFVF